MGLIRKSVTPRLIAANRANSQKSTGPRTPLGKRHASRNAAKHLIFAKVTSASMKELGEDPAELTDLCESLRRTFQPEDDFENMLIEDMAEIRWRKRRLMRAEAGILACQKRQLEIGRKWKEADYGKGLAGISHDMLAADWGLAGLSPSASNFQEIVAALEHLKYSLENEGFDEEESGFLKLVYGQKGSSKGRYLIRLFERGCKEARGEVVGDSQKAAITRLLFMEGLDKEIASFRRLAKLHYARDVEVTESLRDSSLILSEGDFE